VASKQKAILKKRVVPEKKAVVKIEGEGEGEGKGKGKEVARKWEDLEVLQLIVLKGGDGA